MRDEKPSEVWRGLGKMRQKAAKERRRAGDEMPTAATVNAEKKPWPALLRPEYDFDAEMQQQPDDVDIMLQSGCQSEAAIDDASQNESASE